jgi:hypothetical protein
MSRTKTEPITPPNCNASRYGHRTPMLAMNATAAAYSSAVILLLAWISTRSPMAGLNWSAARWLRFSTSLPPWMIAQA